MSVKNIIDTIIELSGGITELCNENCYGYTPEYESIDILMFKIKYFKGKDYSKNMYSELINKIKLITGVHSVEKGKSLLGTVITVTLLSYYKRYLADYEKMIEYSEEVEKIYEFLEGKVSKEFIAGKLITEKKY
uniref:Uncharacterized protein n=1 Tax=viral metagenome TaxID=1070528 RepID=A0A6C0AGC7_9ZZZZ